MDKISLNEIQKYQSLKGWRSKGFAILPHELLFDSRISHTTLVVCWVLIAHQFRGKKFSTPSTRTIAAEARMSRTTVLKGIKELKECGYLEIEKRAGKVSHYFIKV